MASSLAKFNDTISDNLYNSTFHLHQLFSSRQEPTFVMALQLFGDLHGEHKVNMESFRILLRVSCTCASKEASRFLGCGQFLVFIFKHMLGIKHTFPCSFGIKRI